MLMSWDLFRQDIIQKLQGVPDLTSESVPDAIGLRSGDAFFGIIQRGRLFFKVDEESLPAYEEAGSGPLRVKGGFLEAFYEVPFDIRDDALLLRQWANRSVIAARRSSAGEK